jgi:acetyltransferase-like isoleucine patch superfamily enzyme
MYQLLYGIQEKLRIAISRLRSHVVKLQGGHIGRKCLFGHRARIDRPWLVRIGDRTQLEADVWIKVVSDDASISIGERSFVGRGTEIDVASSVIIGNRVLIAPGVFIVDHAHNIKAGILIDEQGCVDAAVSIGDDVWLGTGAVILPGVQIGRGAVIGAGAVVTRNVPENAIVAGIPARIMRYRS